MSSNRPTSESGVPKAVVNRLSFYLRELQQLLGAGKKTISSSSLGKRLGITGAQVRKDFTYFGQFGYPGIGYRCEELVGRIREILGTDRVWPVALVGCGNLGQALLGYGGFERQGFKVMAAFDVDRGIVGGKIDTLDVHHLDDFQSIAADFGIKLAILAVPSTSARSVAERLVAAGIEGILNFAPVTLNLSRNISVVGVDLAMELEQLAFAVVKTGNK